MKRKQAKHPYTDYWLYVVFHRKEGRYQANLVAKDGSNRTTISYARYVMATHLGRMLMEDEHVDHIDNDKSNDNISNLQILSFKENKQKEVDRYRQIFPKYVKLSCAQCGKVFDYIERNYKYNVKKGRTKFNCSRKCSYDSMRK